MEWYLFLIAFLGCLLFLMLLGVPLAIAFLGVNFLFVGYLMGFDAGAATLIMSVYSSITFPFVAIPLFILLGELLFNSGVAVKAVDGLGMWMGKVPGRLSFLSVAGGGLLGIVSGSSLASTSLMGSTMAPEMKARGYHPSMITGPIMASGGLAMVIPPSAMSVLLASYAQISVGKVLIGGLIPGILMGTLYASYIALRCFLNPKLAPAYGVTNVPLSKKLVTFATDILPLGLVVFSVVGFIAMGVATPTESAALSVGAALILTLGYRKWSWEMFKTSVRKTLELSGMILFIIIGAVCFSELLAFSGASRALVNFALQSVDSPLVALAIMMGIVMVLGCFLDQSGIIMLVIPIFMPVVNAMGIDQIWFAILMLINLEMAALTPPIGLILFVMKGVLPDFELKDIMKSAMPFVACDIIAMIMILYFPIIATWLPSLQ